MKLFHKIYSVLAALTLCFGMVACSPDEHDLGDAGLTKADLNEGTGFVIEYDESNPNIVTLKSKLPSSYQVLWDEPQGRVQGSEVTLKIPFAGTYACRMGVETRGGILYGDSCTFNVDQFCAEFVDNPLWTYITGGVGKSKKWYLDVDGKGVCRYFVGPLYFYGTDDCWESVTNGETISGDSWSWTADFAGNGSWMFPSNPTGADYGYMEFDLNNGANITVHDAVKGVTSKGTFMLDTDNHTMKMTDAALLHDPDHDAIVTNWTSMKVLSLTEDHLQLGVIRDNSTEGPALLVYNFISEEYRDNWTPTISTGEVTPTLQDDWKDFVEPKNQNVVTYKLAEDDGAFDWCNLDGSQKNLSGLETIAGVGDLTLVMNHSKQTYSVTTPEGNTVTGTYALSDKGVYTFSAGLPVVQLSTNGTAVFKANADKTLRIMSIALNGESNGLSDLWLGSAERDDQGNTVQYMGYHFKPYVAGNTVKKYSAVLYCGDNTTWTFQNSEPVYITTEGTYTVTTNGSLSEDGKIIYLQVDKLLKDHPNADIIIKDVKVDGKSIDFNDAAITRTVDDSANGGKYNGRRYFYNPWASDNAFASSALTFAKSLSVTFEVKFDTGSVKLK